MAWNDDMSLQITLIIPSGGLVANWVSHNEDIYIILCSHCRTCTKNNCLDSTLARARWAYGFISHPFMHVAFWELRGLAGCWHAADRVIV